MRAPIHDPRHDPSRDWTRDRSREPSGGASLPARLGTIVAVCLVFAGALVSLQRFVKERRPVSRSAWTFVPLEVPPIAEERDVFRELPSDAAAPPSVTRRSTAHSRTLATWRALRAYPGAPPRIPHGLTREEFRDERCLTCHEHGGFAPRFGAYAPITPHPEFEGCLQCHAANNTVVGVALPTGPTASTCVQCHPPGVIPGLMPPSDWVSAPWPGLARRDGTPPVIPHDLQLRGNCLACHMGPGSVAELRTPHPERANCRQCHVTEEEARGEWTHTTVTRVANAEVRR